MNYYVYLLISENKNNPVSYVGYTSDIKKRLKLHNTSKGAKFTKGRKWTLIYKKCYKTKSMALVEEYKLKKNYKKRKKLKNFFLNRCL